MASQGLCLPYRGTGLDDEVDVSESAGVKIEFPPGCVFGYTG